MHSACLGIISDRNRNIEKLVGAAFGVTSSSIMFLSDEEPALKTLDFAFYIGSTPTILYFDLCLNTAYAAHYYKQ